MSRVSTQQADAALAAGRNEEALAIYQQALTAARKAQAIPEERLLVNAGACLRRLSRQEEAIRLLEEGLRHYPYSPSLHNNLANNLADREADRWHTLEHYLMALRLGEGRQGATYAAAHLLKDLHFPVVAYRLIASWWHGSAMEDPPGKDTVRLLLELSLILFEDESLEPITRWCLEQLGSEVEAATLPELLALMGTVARQGDLERAFAFYARARQMLQDDAAEGAAHQEMFIGASWNLAILLLGQGHMQPGWKLYEYGLRAPTKGLQRWQRALPKLFSARQVPLWRGQELPSGSRLLLMAEQAVGDTMMFLQLLPALLERSLQITLVLQPRLVPLYSRTYPALRVLGSEEAEKELQANEFDVQCPVGSLPQHLLEAWVGAGCPQQPIACDTKLKTRLRRSYRQGLPRSRPLIGVSWSGGGQRDRIRIKSLQPDQFGELLRSLDARFVSLQYGDHGRQLEEWRRQGIDILGDADIDPLKDMDAWMAQVAACDLVISVANTTIHGAALAGVPTLCLLSRSPDWRWVRSMDGSYWYDGVDVLRQGRRGSWASALRKVPAWVEARCQDRFRIHSGKCHRHASTLSFQPWL